MAHLIAAALRWAAAVALGVAQLHTHRQGCFGSCLVSDCNDKRWNASPFAVRVAAQRAARTLPRAEVPLGGTDALGPHSHRLPRALLWGGSSTGKFVFYFSSFIFPFLLVANYVAFRLASSGSARVG